MPFPPLRFNALLNEPRKAYLNSPPRNFPFRNRIIPHTLHTRLLTARATRQPLITPILPQPAPVTRAHIAKTTALSASFPSSPAPIASRCYRYHFDIWKAFEAFGTEALDGCAIGRAVARAFGGVAGC